MLKLPTYAHIFLPAVIWAEKEGCFTNTERCVNIVRKVKEPYENTKTDLHIFNEVAKQFEQSEKMNFPNKPAEVFEEMRHLSKGRLRAIALNITGPVAKNVTLDGVLFHCHGASQCIQLNTIPSKLILTDFLTHE